MSYSHNNPFALFWLALKDMLWLCGVVLFSSLLTLLRLIRWPFKVSRRQRRRKHRSLQRARARNKSLQPKSISDWWRRVAQPNVAQPNPAASVCSDTDEACGADLTARSVPRLAAHRFSPLFPETDPKLPFDPCIPLLRTCLPVIIINKAAASPHASGKQLMLIDSGANTHCTADRNALLNLRQIAPVSIQGVAQAVSEWVGDLPVRVPWSDGTHSDFLLRDVLLIPSVDLTILSTSRLLEDFGISFSTGPRPGDGYICEVAGTRSCKLSVFRNGLLGLNGTVTGSEFEPNNRWHDLIHENVNADVYSELSHRSAYYAPWHERLNHLSKASIERVLGSAEPPKGKKGWGLPETDLCLCESCIKGKLKKKPKSKGRPFSILSRHNNGVIAVDIVDVTFEGRGFCPSGRSSKAKHLLHFVDAHSRFGWCYPLERKSDAGKALRIFLTDNQVFPQHLLLPSSFILDNASEFTGPKTEFRKICDEYRIKLSPVPAASSELNGIVERANLTLFQAIRCSLFHARLPPGYWPDAATYARHVMNVVPSRNNDLAVEGSGPRFISPFELWTGSRPRIGHLRVFGCKVMVLANKPHKLASRAETAIFLGLGSKPGSYLVEMVATRSANKPRHVRDCLFDEDNFPLSGHLSTRARRDLASLGKTLGQSVSFPTASRGSSEETQSDSDSSTSTDSDSSGDTSADSDSDGNCDDLSVHLALPVPNDPALTVDKWCISGAQQQLLLGQRRKGLSTYTCAFLSTFALQYTHFLDSMSSKAAYHLAGASAGEVYPPEPNDHDPSLKSALSCPTYGSYWKAALDAEWKNLFDTGAVEWCAITDVPHDQRPITAKIVCKYKVLERRYKCRIVIRGFQQARSTYEETFAPTVSAGIVKLIMAIAVKLGYSLHTIDIKSAFLMADLPVEIFMHPPTHFKRAGHVLRIRKSLYGLRNAPFLFNELLNGHLEDYGLARSQLDPSLYYCKSRSVYLVTHVDDCLVTGPESEIEALTQHLRTKFTLSKAGPVTEFLGMVVDYDKVAGVLSLSQDVAIKALVTKFAAYLPRRKCRTPLQTSARLVPPSDDERSQQPAKPPRKGKPAEFQPYPSGVGSLMHLYNMTRPDLSFAVSQLARFMSNYSESHMEQLFHTIAYLRDTGEVKLVFRRESIPDNLAFDAYCDSDWATDAATRRSCSGQVLMLGASFYWKSQMQSKTALSSGEAEFVSIGECCRTVLFFRSILSEIGLGQAAPTVIWSDASAAIGALDNLKVNSNLRHVETRFHRVRDEVRAKSVVLDKVPTAENLADSFTKQLPGPQFHKLHKLMCGVGGFPDCE